MPYGLLVKRCLGLRTFFYGLGLSAFWVSFRLFFFSQYFTLPSREVWEVMHVPPSRHKQETFFMTLQFISFCIGRIMLFCQAINITECFSIIKPFEGFGSKKTPRPYANNSVVRVVKLRLFPSPPRALDSCTRCRFFGGTCISKKS